MEHEGHLQRFALLSPQRLQLLTKAGIGCVGSDAEATHAHAYIGGGIMYRRLRSENGVTSCQGSCEERSRAV